MSTRGYTGISLAGRWECGACGATGDGWYDEEDGFTMDAPHDDCSEYEASEAGEGRG